VQGQDDDIVGRQDELEEDEGGERVEAHALEGAASGDDDSGGSHGRDPGIELQLSISPDLGCGGGKNDVVFAMFKRRSFVVHRPVNIVMALPCHRMLK
jgi:hypothetical protein